MTSLAKRMVWLGFLTTPVCLPLNQAGADEIAQGVVFHDQNENGAYETGEPLLEDVRVSNGTKIVRTDAQGRYEIEVDQDAIIFVIKPRNWRTPLSKAMLPRFYYIHKPQGSPELTFPGVTPSGPLPESIDFPLYPQKEPDQFKAVFFGDPQPRNQKEIDYMSHDVIEELIGTDASFGVTLGDIVFDNLALFEPQSHSIALVGIPWYNVIGNHDINRDVTEDFLSDESFERVFGPAYYSFEHGPVHFIVLDDIEWYIDAADGNGKYRGGLGKEQMTFVQNDLMQVPDEQLVVLMMHIPLDEVEDRQELYRLIEKRKFCMSLSGHEHYHQHRFITHEDGWQGPEAHHHVVNVTVSGSWWGGAPDERGIPHTLMRDGAPNGYSFITFDGNKYALDFKAAGRPTDYQMNIYAPEEIASVEVTQTEIYVNVFNGNEHSKVEMRIGDETKWQTMTQEVTNDPRYVELVAEEQSLTGATWVALPVPEVTPHLWHAKLSETLLPGTHAIQIRATDRNGRTISARRIIRVLPAVSASPGE